MYSACSIPRGKATPITMSAVNRPTLTLADGGRQARESRLEADFLFYLGTIGKHLPAPEREVRFHPERKWRFDFAWPANKVAVELEGTLPRFGGRHQRMAGFDGDCEKYNSALVLGWRVLRYSGGMLKADPQGVLEQIKGLLEQK